MGLPQSNDTTAFCVWLMPSKQSFNFNDIIQRYVSTYKTPEFAAHITLFCGKTTHLPTLIDRFNALFDHACSATSNINGMIINKSFFQSLALTFKKTESLLALHKLSQALDPKSQYEFNPHLSLLYGRQDTIPLEFTINNGAIIFDKIYLMSDCDGENNECICSWHQIQHSREITLQRL